MAFKAIRFMMQLSSMILETTSKVARNRRPRKTARLLYLIDHGFWSAVVCGLIYIKSCADAAYIPCQRLLRGGDFRIPRRGPPAWAARQIAPDPARDAVPLMHRPARACPDFPLMMNLANDKK
jgi:hypothetical protein